MIICQKFKSLLLDKSSYLLSRGKTVESLLSEHFQERQLFRIAIFEPDFLINSKNQKSQHLNLNLTH